MRHSRVSAGQNRGLVDVVDAAVDDAVEMKAGNSGRLVEAHGSTGAALLDDAGNRQDGWVPSAVLAPSANGVAPGSILMLPTAYLRWNWIQPGMPHYPKLCATRRGKTHLGLSHVMSSRPDYHTNYQFHCLCCPRL